MTSVQDSLPLFHLHHGPESLPHGSLPDSVHAIDINGTHFVMSPPLQHVQDAASEASKHRVAGKEKLEMDREEQNKA